MSKPLAKSLLKLGVALVVELLVAAVYFFVNIPLSRIPETKTVDIVLVLCDAFFVPGALALMIGLLIWVASEGGLDAVSYLGSCLVKVLVPGRHGTLESYGDYLEQRRGKSKKGGTRFLCIAGLTFLLIASIFLALFYALY